MDVSTVSGGGNIRQEDIINVPNLLLYMKSVIDSNYKGTEAYSTENFIDDTTVLIKKGELKNRVEVNTYIFTKLQFL